MMKINLLDLNVPKLFEERNVDDIVKIDKYVDAEIERKRTELRSMVGDRYKDILAATEAIKCMENLSCSIVDDIEKVKNRSEVVVQNTFTPVAQKTFTVSKERQDERVVLVQIKMVIDVNEETWVALDKHEFSKAAQLHLLSQHIYTGLRLLKQDVLEKYKIVKMLKDNLDRLRLRVLNGTNDKLQTVHLTTEDTCSNLNALIFLENYAGSDLLQKFIDLRKNALKTVIQSSYPSVRAQVSAMVDCLYTTIRLLHDCFLNYDNTLKGLIWHQLEEISGPDSPPTLSKIMLPPSNLLSYIPEIIKQFRPKCPNIETSLPKDDSMKLIDEWIKDTRLKVAEGLKKSLELVPNVNGLHIIREEALKTKIPENWDEICRHMELPKNFNIWNSFFQDLITNRTIILLTKTITTNVDFVKDELIKSLNSISKDDMESDLRSYIWQDDKSEFNISGNENSTLSMKTRGFSPNIVKLSKVFDSKCSVLLEDISLYLYGKERVDNKTTRISKVDNKNKYYKDHEKLEHHLKQETATNINRLIKYLENLVNEKKEEENFVVKSIFCARFLHGLTTLCPHLIEIMCTNSSSDWEKVCDELTKSSLVFWKNWMENCNKLIQKECEIHLSDIDTISMLSLLCRWDSIEIQEQTDEKVFKSKISVPMKTSTALHEIFDRLCEILNAVLPHTLPKQVHLEYIESNALIILEQYKTLLATSEINQTQALQFLFDVKFLTTFCIPRENMELIQRSQDICDKLRSFVDPFDLDVFYKYLQHNVKQNVLQSQVIFGSLLPSSNQLASLGMLEKEHEKEPSILAVSTPAVNNWFLLLPVTAPIQKTTHITPAERVESAPSKPSKSNKKGETASGVRSGAAALFGAMTTDWFS